jgi:aminobenzoyl-glutamate utilization protein B
MFGAGSMGAALAIKELIENGKLSGTVRFYGTPAEEAVGGKIYMAREGLFDDLDFSFDWHPSNQTKANVQSSQALMDMSIVFKGKAAHAAFDPWNGRSAADGAELFTSGVNYYREHIRPSSRIHYVIKSAGDVPNVVAEKAEVWLWVRDSKRAVIEEMYQRMQQIAKGAALMADVEVEVKLNSGDHEILVNRKGGYALHKNLELLKPLKYSADEIAFATKIQEATGKKQLGMDSRLKSFELTKEHPSGGSTDVGDVSWLVPQISLMVATAPADTPWHSWAVVACGGMSIGHKGLVYASKAMALTMIDLYQDEKLRSEVKAEFTKRKGNYVYKPMLPDGPPPIPKSK